MNVKFLDAAKQEIKQAVAHYNDKAPNLGGAFLLELKELLERISDSRHGGHPYSARIRRRMLRGFPYVMIYQELGDEILVIAVASVHREGEDWESRIKK
jgi:plasmid stabilization system protein ParE